VLASNPVSALRRPPLGLRRGPQLRPARQPAGDNARLIRGLYEAWQRSGDIAESTCITPDIEVHEGSGRLRAVTRGRVGLERAMQSFVDLFDDPGVEVEECAEIGDEVVARVNFYGRVNTSGAVRNLRTFHLWTVRDGKVLSCRISSPVG